MFVIDRLILIGAVLLLVGIVSSKFSARLGLPVMVLFIAVGMLAGSEGLGGIPFEDYSLAHGVGTLALAVILFDGGLRTSLASFRLAWRPSLALSTGGVLVTAAVTGAAAALIVGVHPLMGMLLGSIVSSTDAAAVFSVLRGQGVRLRERLAATLEIESGSNDPMAVFLTLGLIQVIAGDVRGGWGMLGFLLLQAGVGVAAGLAVGGVAVAVINRINLGAAGLYPILTGAFGLLAYGASATFGGSGFLSVYLAGILLGNSRIVFERGTYLFHDAAAWISQILMFVVLGLLSFPTRLLAVAWQGLAVALVLILVARPLAVALVLLPFRFPRTEVVFLSWVGLKGAVPVILATYPLILGLPGSHLLFDIVFFVVLVSALTQGWTLPRVARRLGVQLPREPVPPVALEISSLYDVDGDIVDYVVEPGSRPAGRRVRDLALPDGAVVAMIVRERMVIPPRGSTEVHAGDHVFVVLRRESRPLVDRVFGRDPGGSDEASPPAEFPLRGGTTVGELEEFYGIRLHDDPDRTLDEVLRIRLGEAVRTGATVRFGPIRLTVREVVDEAVEVVVLSIPPAGQEDAPAADPGRAV